MYIPSHTTCTLHCEGREEREECVSVDVYVCVCVCFSEDEDSPCRFERSQLQPFTHGPFHWIFLAVLPR